MRRDEVIAKLKEAEPALRGFGVAALYLFGSHARDEAQSGSDWTSSSIRLPTAILDFCRSWMRMKPSRVMESRSRGVLDTPHARGMTAFCGAALCPSSGAH
jgi:hypothetical protein